MILNLNYDRQSNIFSFLAQLQNEFQADKKDSAGLIRNH